MRIKVGLLFAAVAAASLLASGCQFYFGGNGDDDAVCVGGRPEGAIAPVRQARNPYTGECVNGGGGGGGGGGCNYPNHGSPPPTATDAIWFDARWPVCENECNALSEEKCMVADGCRAIYIATNGCPPGTQCGGPPVKQVFSACWATSSDGPIRGGDCNAITDAFQCAQHDDCAAVHNATSACGPSGDCAGVAPGQFISCLPEPGVDNGACWSDTDCGMNETCDKVNFCEPDPTCVPTPGGTACPPVCWGKCVPAVTPPPPPPPPPPPASCANLDEDTCIDMADGCIDTGSQPSCGMIKCEPIYAGSGCNCTPAGCTCQTWSYQTCQSAS